MAKKRKEYGTGKSVKDIITGISRNIGRATEKTLRSAVTRLSSAMNKRVDRAAKEGRDSPALREVRESGGRFSAKGKDKEGLKAEFIRLKNFFTNPTSTQKGWEKIQKEAEKEARKRGVLKPSGGQTTPPPSPVPKIGGGSLPPEPVPGGPLPGEDAEPIEGGSGWTPPPGWTWDETTRSWTHPDYGSGWIPYEGEGGGLLDPMTAELVGNTARSIHDYDATEDPKRWGEGTETGKLWQMVDSISKVDPRFTRRLSYNDPANDPRMQLFNAIDDAWSNDPTLSFEAARDLVMGRLDQIYEEAQGHMMSAAGVSFSTFFSDEDDW